MPSSGFVAETNAKFRDNCPESCHSGIYLNDGVLNIVLSLNRFLNNGIAEKLTSQNLFPTLQNDPLRNDATGHGVAALSRCCVIPPLNDT
jgi:hypothetical protein